MNRPRRKCAGPIVPVVLKTPVVTQTPGVTKTTLLSLPKELIDIIFSHLSLVDRYSLMHVSKEYNKLVLDPYFWQSVFAKDVRVNRFDAMIAQLSKWHHLRTIHLNYFNWVISGRMIELVVKACPKLEDLKLTVSVHCRDNDMMTSLSKLTNLKKLIVESNLEAFAPSFTTPALKCWSGLRVLEFSQKWESPPKNHNLDYEFIDLDGIVKQIALSHGDTLRTLKIDFPLRSRPVNRLTSASLNLISRYCPHLESLWLQTVACKNESIMCLRQLSLLESLTINIDQGITFSGLGNMLGIADGKTESVFRKLKKFYVVLDVVGISKERKAAFDRLKKSANFELWMKSDRAKCYRSPMR